MKRYYYDLHTHSCLSPCADNDATPNSLAGIASLSGVNILALTDHNTAKNCPAFFNACLRYGVIPVAGMELTTSEDIHVVCLFEELEYAMAFDEAVSERRYLIKNRPDIFGEQLIVDEFDNVLGKEEYLLSNATSISVEEVAELAAEFCGIAYPAHIDRTANGIIAVLGVFSPAEDFSCFEVHDGKNSDYYIEKYGLGDKRVIVSSDAHYLDIPDAENYFELDVKSDEPDAIRHALFAYLRGEATE